MAKTILQAKNYQNRVELENVVRDLSGLTPDSKIHKIEGTREELERLQLSDTTLFWGISCKITDTPTTTTPQKEEVNRGKKFNYKIK